MIRWVGRNVHLSGQVNISQPDIAVNTGFSEFKNRREGSDIKNSITALLSVKRIIALMVTATFVYLSVNGIVDAENFIPIYTMIVGYYFGQSTVRETKKD